MSKKSIAKIVLGTMVILAVSVLVLEVAYLAVYFPVNANLKQEETRSEVLQNNASLASASDIASFTEAELSLYDGKSGRPAYVAVNGVVYDVTEYAEWYNGQHQGLNAGMDLTEEFNNSPHLASMLNDMTVMGKLEPEAQYNTLENQQELLPEETQPPQPDTISAASADIAEPLSPAGGSSSGTSTGTGDSQSGWTLEMLAQYDGRNGNPAYIAVNGTIYDVTNIGAWNNGYHHGYQAGKDLTAAFASSPHSLSILNGAPVVGKLQSPVTLSSQTSGQSYSSYDDDDDDEDEYEYEDDDDDDHDDDD